MDHTRWTDPSHGTGTGTVLNHARPAGFLVVPFDKLRERGVGLVRQ